LSPPEDRGSRFPSDAAMYEAFRDLERGDTMAGLEWERPQRVRRPRNREDVDEDDGPLSLRRVIKPGDMKGKSS
jgi:hypothetical protein